MAEHDACLCSQVLQQITMFAGLCRCLPICSYMPLSDYGLICLNVQKIICFYDKYLCSTEHMDLYEAPGFISISGGTSVGNHNRSSVGIGCCCRCDFPIIISSWIIRFGVHVSLLILVHGHVFTSSFNCTAQQLNSIFTKRLLVLFFSDLVAYVKHVINNLNCCFFLFFFLQIQIIIIKKT